MVVIFQPQRNFIIDRLWKSIRNVFSAEPLVVNLPPDEAGWGGMMYISGDREAIERQIASQPDLQAFVKRQTQRIRPKRAEQVKVTTDDWPYLYIRSPQIPALFYALIPILLLLWFLASKSYRITAVLRDHAAENMHFMSLGAAFALLEVYGINQAAIVFGNTWQVNCVIIAGILLMVLVANAVVHAFPRLPHALAYAGIMGVCALLYFFPFSSLVSRPLPQQVGGVSLLCGLPMLFSGIIFARSFVAAAQRNQALSANLFGTLIGGILQLLTFASGIRSLLLLVAGFYCLSMVFDPRRGHRSISAGADPYWPEPSGGLAPHSLD